MTITGIVCFWLGMLQYHDRLKTWHFFTLVLNSASTVAMIWLYQKGHPQYVRILIADGMSILFLVLSAWSALYRRSRGKTGRFIFGVSNLFLASVFVVHSVLYVNHPQWQSVFSNHIVSVLMSMSLIFWNISTGFGIALMVSQWAENQTGIRANQDQLTGLYNRYGWTVRLYELLGSKKMENAAFSLALLDIDHFKSINDKHGHLAGDQVLKEIAVRLRANIRSHDILVRFGGEEFLALLPETSIECARLWAERIRRVIAASPVLFEGKEIRITISVGVASASHQQLHLNCDQVIGHADKALYWAKNGGRDKVCAYHIQS